MNYNTRASKKLLSPTNKTNSETQTTVWWLLEGKGVWERVKRVKRVKYMVTKGNSGL